MKTTSTKQPALASTHLLATSRSEAVACATGLNRIRTGFNRKPFFVQIHPHAPFETCANGILRVRF